MKAKLTAAFLMSYFLCGAFLWADTPELESGVKINNGSSPIEFGWAIAVNCVDWDNDGAKDLIVTKNIGIWVNILLYRNQGTDLNPVFNGCTKIESNGSPIKIDGC